MNLDERSFLEDVGYRIRAWRTHAKMSQAHLAELCGLHRTFIGGVERGQKNISLLNLRLIAGKLRVKLSALLPEGKLPPEERAG